MGGGVPDYGATDCGKLPVLREGNGPEFGLRQERRHHEGAHRAEFSSPRTKVNVKNDDEKMEGHTKTRTRSFSDHGAVAASATNGDKNVHFQQSGTSASDLRRKGTNLLDPIGNNIGLFASP